MRDDDSLRHLRNRFKILPKRRYIIKILHLNQVFRSTKTSQSYDNYKITSPGILPARKKKKEITKSTSVKGGIHLTNKHNVCMYTL
ncbi:hypothetical protein PUN28_008491 [Cardiocondyla obscurior]|uniref:Uncharacterized protein n=1 Tax=Cardiocondyla obscurior TaxID=286306 RepID=A0AAW2FZU5_9HYME